MKIAMFDLDGCLSDDRRRLTLLPEEGSPSAAYNAYHADLLRDPVMNMEFVDKHRKQGHLIVFNTARPESTRKATCSWLKKWFGEMDNWALLMRRSDQQRIPSPELKVRNFEIWHDGHSWKDVVAGYDDRKDVLAAYDAAGAGEAELICLTYPERLKGLEAVIDRHLEEALAHPTPNEPEPPAPVYPIQQALLAMAETSRKRGEVYGENYLMMGPIMKAFFPEGVTTAAVHSDAFHMFVIILHKLARFSVTGLTHRDSIHDAAVYAAMIESVLPPEGEGEGE